MIWVTWRQLRAQSIAAATMLVLLGGLLLATSFDLAGQAKSTGLSACHGVAACQTAASDFLSLVKGSPMQMVFFVGLVLIYVVPGLIGMFWGAPMVAREIETGTFRLAWNQSVSRARWVFMKLALIGLAAMVIAGLIGLMTSWWASPIYRAGTLSAGGGFVPSRINPIPFGAQGIAPLGYAAFAFALGVTVGLLIRRTIPAMAVTLLVFAFIQIAWPAWVRPHLVSPASYIKPLNVGHLDEVMIGNGKTMTVQQSATKPGAWILSNVSVKPDGQVFTGPPTKACLGQGFKACNASIARLHLHQRVTYQPASRFWELQWIETGVFLALAIALAGFCAWWVRRRQLT